MKTIRFIIFGAIASTFTIVACQRDAHKETVTTTAATVMGTTADKGNEVTPQNGACNSTAYSVVLESHNQVGDNWEWIWSVQNPNPGNGTNGTVQNLSHWGMQFGTCFNWASVVSAAYSGDGSTWTAFTPSYSVDPSQNCMTTPVLKFDFGTNGGNKSYYKLVVSEAYVPGSAPGYYKSGRNTGCCTFSFNGIGCVVGPQK